MVSPRASVFARKPPSLPVTDLVSRVGREDATIMGLVYAGLVFAQLATFCSYAVVTAGAGAWLTQRALSDRGRPADQSPVR